MELRHCSYCIAYCIAKYFAPYPQVTHSTILIVCVVFEDPDPLKRAKRLTDIVSEHDV